jgi:8-oxo-dGTP pyrophosphatase MutT (NUDIX family)
VRYKAVAYVEHRLRPGHLAAFVHGEDEEPLFESGLQVPAGSIESGETEAAAALREAREETGLTDLEVVRRIGEDTIEWPNGRRQHRVFYHLTGTGPDRWRNIARHEGAPGRAFDFQWIPFDLAPQLAAGQGLLVYRLHRRSC